MRQISPEAVDYLRLFAECKKEVGATDKEAERAVRQQLALPTWTLERMGNELADYKQRIIAGFVESGTPYAIASQIMENVCVFDEHRAAQGINPCDVMANSVRWNRMVDVIGKLAESQAAVNQVIVEPISSALAK